MPFDAADSNWKGDPEPKPGGSFPWLLDTLREYAWMCVAIVLALLVGGIAGAAVDGFPDMSPIGSELQTGSIIAQTVGTGSFLLVLAGFVWWRVRQFLAG